MSNDTKEAREKEAEEARAAREARAAEVKKTEPKPGEGGYYSPPKKEAGVTHQAQQDLPGGDEIPPGMAPEEQPVSTVSPGATVAAEKAATGGGSESDEVDYSDYTVAELKDMAHKRGIDIHSDMLKDDIIKALKKADKAA
jgi:hypothetical protein